MKLGDEIKHYFASITINKVIGVLLGNVIIGLGVAGLRMSLMGNDPYTAMNLAVSDVLHWGLGNYQLLLNLVLFTIQVVWGRKYIGFGTLINMCLLGYLVEFWSWIITLTIGGGEGHSFFYQIIYMIISLILVALGLSMYQTSNLGVSPYDYLALGLTDHFKPPYFAHRVITDAICVSVIVIIVLCGALNWGNCHLGIGTVMCAFFFGPIIHFFDRYNRKWILTKEEQKTVQ